MKEQLMKDSLKAVGKHQRNRIQKQNKDYKRSLIKTAIKNDLKLLFSFIFVFIFALYGVFDFFKEIILYFFSN